MISLRREFRSISYLQEAARSRLLSVELKSRGGKASQRDHAKKFSGVVILVLHTPDGLNVTGRLKHTISQIVQSVR